jgi:hypothetical protein
MLICASSISLASGLIDRLIKPLASIASYQAFGLIFAIIAIIIVIIMFRKYKIFLQTGRVINAGNAEFGSTIRNPRLSKALKKLARYAAVFFFARVCNKPARYAMVFCKRVTFLLNQYDMQRLFQTEFLLICVNFCRLILININSKSYYNYGYNKAFVRTYNRRVK